MELLLVALLLLGSAFFAGSELAVTMSQRARLRTYSANGSWAARAALKLREHPERAIALCLVGNNLANVGVAVFGRQALVQRWSLGEVAADVVTMLVLVPLVLILGEIVPKAVSQINPDRALVFLALPLLAIGVLLSPVLVLAILVAQVVRLMVGLRSRPLAFASRDELKKVLAHSVSSGHVAVGERDLIHRIVEFWKMDLQPLMRPLRDIATLPEGSSMQQVREFMRHNRLSRLPIVKADGSNIVGVLTATRLLSADNTAPIGRYLQEPVRVAAGVQLSELMTALQKSPSQIAVIERPGPGVTVVLLDDLLNSLLGREAETAAAARVDGADQAERP
jgi:putative hemolysin